MEVSGPLLQAAAPVTVSLEQQLYTEGVAQIKASDLLDPQKQQGIKRLTYEFIRRSRPRPLLSLDAQSFFSQDNIRTRITAFSALSYTNMLLFPSHNEISLQRHLIAIRAILIPSAKYYLSNLFRTQYPEDNEIKACFDKMDINIYSQGLEDIKKAIEDRITPSKQDIEITARVIKKELALLDGGRDFVFTKFTEENYREEFGKDLKRASTLKDNITRLDFSHKLIKVVPNILGEFTNLGLLGFTGCTSLTFPPDVSGNQALTWLSFEGCSNLTAPPDVRNNPALTSLCFFRCTNLITPPDLSGNQKLEGLYFSDCTRLTTPPDLSRNKVLVELYFSNCTNLQIPLDLNKLTNLMSLCFDGVFPEESGLNRNVYADLEKTQALIRAIEAYILSL